MIVIKPFFFVFGLLVGSFLNVVVYRIPRNESVIHPRSKCPSCGTLIKWYQNIPLISYIIQKGKCAYCEFKIPLRYPLLELTVGFFAFFLAPERMDAMALINFSFYFSIASVFLAHLIIDLEHQILPDKLNIYLLLITLPYVATNFPPLYWILGGLIGFFGPYGVTVLFYKLRGVVGLGGGDIKLFGILGLILGPVGILNNIFMSCFLGAVIGVILIAAKRLDKDTHFAFGPFIIVVASLQIFFPTIVEIINPLYIK